MPRAARKWRRITRRSLLSIRQDPGRNIFCLGWGARSNCRDLRNETWELNRRVMWNWRGMGCIAKGPRMKHGVVPNDTFRKLADRLRRFRNIEIVPNELRSQDMKPIPSEMWRVFNLSAYSIHLLTKNEETEGDKSWNLTLYSGYREILMGHQISIRNQDIMVDAHILNTNKSSVKKLPWDHISSFVSWKQNWGLKLKTEDFSRAISWTFKFFQIWLRR